jgi:hypothetical protein
MKRALGQMEARSPLASQDRRIGSPGAATVGDTHKETICGSITVPVRLTVSATVTAGVVTVPPVGAGVGAVPAVVRVMGRAVRVAAVPGVVVPAGTPVLAIRRERVPQAARMHRLTRTDKTMAKMREPLRNVLTSASRVSAVAGAARSP